MTRLDQDKIQHHIIHRYENLLLDDVTLNENDDTVQGELSLLIDANDPLNRDIFLKEKFNGQQVLLPCVGMEILALGAIVSTGKLKPGEMVIYTGIGQYKRNHDFVAGERITGNVLQKSVKGPFLRYLGSLSTPSGELVCEGDMKAFFTQADTTNDDSAAKKIDLPELNHNLPLDPQWFSYKADAMKVADAMLFLDNTSIITSYTYPDTHPFTKGHFPGNPIMMGIMQWISIEDACLTYCLQHDIQGHTTLSCQAKIINQDEHLVSDILGITVDVWVNVDGIPNQAEIQTTKRLSFRTMVRPNEEIYTYLSDISVTSQ